MRMQHVHKADCLFLTTMQYFPDSFWVDSPVTNRNNLEPGSTKCLHHHGRVHIHIYSIPTKCNCLYWCNMGKGYLMNNIRNRTTRVG